MLISPAVLALNGVSFTTTLFDSLEISYDVLLDRDGTVGRAYDVSGLPTTVFIDRQGRLYNRIIGESTPEVFEQVVKELL